MKIKKFAPYVIILAGIGLGLYGCKKEGSETPEKPTNGEIK